MEIMNNSDLKKMRDKNLHLFLYEEVPVADPKHKIQSMMKPVLDCEEVAQIQDDIWKFPNVQLISSNLE